MEPLLTEPGRLVSLIQECIEPEKPGTHMAIVHLEECSSSKFQVVEMILLVK